MVIHLEVQEKLQRYRADKLKLPSKRQKNSNMLSKSQVFIGQIFKNVLTDTEKLNQSPDTQPPVAVSADEECDDKLLLNKQVDTDLDVSPITYEATSDWSMKNNLILILKILLWLISWKIFIIWGFGAVFFILSCFAFMWCTMYTGKKRSGLSAYSVFNENCEQIFGAYTAEKFERELLHR